MSDVVLQALYAEVSMQGCIPHAEGSLGDESQSDVLDNLEIGALALVRKSVPSWRSIGKSRSGIRLVKEQFGLDREAGSEQWS